MATTDPLDGTKPSSNAGGRPPALKPADRVQKVDGPGCVNCEKNSTAAILCLSERSCIGPCNAELTDLIQREIRVFSGAALISHGSRKRHSGRFKRSNVAEVPATPLFTQPGPRADDLAKTTCDICVWRDALIPTIIVALKNYRNDCAITMTSFLASASTAALKWNFRSSFERDHQKSKVKAADGQTLSDMKI